MMLRTPLDTWRSTLLVSLGLAAGGCGGEADSEGAAPPDGTGAPLGDATSQAQVVLPAALRCQGDAPSDQGPGLMQCENGIVHRPAQPAEPACTGCPPPGPVFVGFGKNGCSSDADCRPGALCITSLEVAATTRSCSATTGEALRQLRELFACQSPDDECAVAAQCATGQLCLLAGGVRRCDVDEPFPCGVPGRPFLVEGEGRVAPPRSSSNWCGLAFEAATDLDLRSLSVVAGHWQSAALLEHASIAAFARFTLQLLQLGAPLALSQASQRAMRDELEHAQRCFALAARYAGSPRGPGALPVAGALQEQSLASIVVLTFREGCVGETCAALEAAEALAVASDSHVQDTLALIARDERRHAELAWRFVAWALERDATGQVGGALRGELDRVQDELTREYDLATGCDGGGAVDPALARHGVLTGPKCRVLRRAALAHVVLPCAERLLARRRGAAAPALA